jgi:hypothetical protein
VEENVLLEFVSHIDGKNAKVQVFADRVEWNRAGGVSKGKAWLGVATGGVSLLATGISDKKGASEMIPIRSLTSVTVERDGLRNMKVRLIASGNTIDMRVSKAEADQIKDTLTRLMLGTHPALQSGAEQPPPPPATPSNAPDPADQIRKLAELRDAGILSVQEFEAKKQDLLDRM